MNSKDKKLTGLTIAVFVSCLILACSSDYSTVAKYQPEQISCIDHATPQLIRNAENAFGKLEWSGTSIKQGSNEEKRLYNDFKKLADSGNPYGMGFFGDALHEGLITTYLEDKHISNRKEATTVKLPDTMKKDMVTALSYLYIALIIKGDHQERVREVINQIQTSGSQDSPLLSNYVSIPDEWFQEAKTNAQQWQAHCSQSN